MLDVGCWIVNCKLYFYLRNTFQSNIKNQFAAANQKSLSAISASISKFVPEATTPPKPQKELLSVAFLVLWLCTSAHKALRFRRGEKKINTN